MKLLTSIVLSMAVLGGPARAACVAAARPGARIEGVVRAVADGDTLCLQTTGDHLDLTRVRLADVKAPHLTGPGGEGAKWALRRAARGKTVVCEMQGADSGVCSVAGTSVARLLSRR